ncbi:MAG: hypothetical protein MI866_12920, partial [Bacteroidales bacterium]|nr:hypothetical protein [Bacteroidales bacterium]
MRYNKTIYKLVLLVTLFIVQISYSSLFALNVTTSQTVAGPLTYNELVTIVDNGNPNDTVIYTIDGNFTCTELTVQANTYMIVKGDLVVGDVNLNNVDFQVFGTLVVTGNLDVRGKNSLELNIETTGVLVVGGGYDYTGKNGGAAETNDGQMYLSDPNDFGGDGNDSGDIGDLIESGVLPSDLEEEFVENVDESVFTTSTWNGGSTQWDSDGNWNNTGTPTSGDNVFIGAGQAAYPQFCTGNEYFMWNLELETGAELVIPAGSKVTILGDIIIPSGATLTVQNSDANPTSFMVLGTVTGDIKFEWTLGALHWWFMGHPIYNPSMDTYRAVESGSTTYAFYDYQSSGLVNLADDEDFSFTTTVDSEDILRGYQFKVSDQVTISHTGKINNSAVYSKKVQTGWQIICNPYPSYYQLPVDAQSTGDFAKTDGTVYVSNSDTNADKSFDAFNVFSGLGTSADYTWFDGIIAPGQAFYIKTDATALATDLLYMRASNRVHATGVSLKSTVKPAETNVLRLKLSNESGLTDEAVIALRENGSFEMTKLDSEQLMQSGTDYSFIYSLVEEKKAVINVLPQLTANHAQAMGVKTAEGRQSIKIAGLDNLVED